MKACKDRPRDFLAATGLTHEEFGRLLPVFAAADAALYPPDKTLEGKVRQRQVGGGAKGLLVQMEDKLLFIVVYQKTNPLQTMHGLQFGLTYGFSNDTFLIYVLFWLVIKTNSDCEFGLKHIWLHHHIGTLPFLLFDRNYFMC